MYTTSNEGLINNYATEPETYYAVYPSPEQRRNYALQGAIALRAVPEAIATLVVTALVLVSLAVS